MTAAGGGVWRGERSTPLPTKEHVVFERRERRSRDVAELGHEAVRTNRSAVDCFNCWSGEVIAAERRLVHVLFRANVGCHLRFAVP